MQMMNKLVLLSFFALTLVGCAGNRYQPPAPVYDPYGQVEPDPVRVEKYPVWSANPEQKIEQPFEPAQQPVPFQDQAPQQATSPAVIALLSDAESSSRAGKLDTAAATIERALRIEPRNSKLVFKLA